LPLLIDLPKIAVQATSVPDSAMSAGCGDRPWGREVVVTEQHANLESGWLGWNIRWPN